MFVAFIFYFFKKASNFPVFRVFLMKTKTYDNFLRANSSYINKFTAFFKARDSKINDF